MLRSLTDCLTKVKRTLYGHLKAHTDGMRAVSERAGAIIRTMVL